MIIKNQNRYLRNYKLFLTVIIFFASCKTDLIVRPLHKSEHLSAIEKLPAEDKIRQQEMTDWFLTHVTLTGGLVPDWEHPIQTMYSGHQVVEISCGPEAAFFFNKVNGKLNIYAAAWQDKDPTAYMFIGNIVYFSYTDRKLTLSQYNKYGVTKTRTIKLPQVVKGEEDIAVKIMSQQMWEYLNKMFPTK